MSDSARRAGRPLSRILTPDKIVEEALALLQRSGDAGFTVNALARSLGVSSSALYNHVSSKRELLILVQDHVIGQINYHCFDRLPWADAVSMWARSMRDAFVSHSSLIPIYAVMPVTDSSVVLGMYESVTRGFLAADWPEASVLHAIVTVESFVLGSAMDATAPENVFDAADLAEQFPVFARANESSRSASGVRRADAAFELGLTSLIAGLSGGRSRK